MVLKSLTLPAAVILGFTAVVSGQQSSVAPDESWREEAQIRIERYRQGSFRVEWPHLPSGAKEVRIEQTGHHFRFGVAVAAGPLLREDTTGQRYRDFITRHFNTIVAENAMKWYSLEPNFGELRYEDADAMVEFAEMHGLYLRGHTLFWAKPHWVQPWAHQLDDAGLLTAVQRHLRRTVRRYQGRVQAWDVNNEMINGTFFRDRLGPEIRAWMYQEAHRLDPEAPLFVNEYGLLRYPVKLEEFLFHLQDLRTAGAPVHAIGLQMHHTQVIHVREGQEPEDAPALVSPRRIWEVLDILAETGLPLEFTEVSANTADEDLRARTLEALALLAFSHPAVESFLLWGFWQNAHFRGRRGALLDSEFNLLPAGEVLLRLLESEWKTRTTVSLGRNPYLVFRGFYGQYRLTMLDGEGELLAEEEFRFSPEQRRALWLFPGNTSN